MEKCLKLRSPSVRLTLQHAHRQMVSYQYSPTVNGITSTTRNSAVVQKSKKICCSSALLLSNSACLS
ncbi:hypothetical protein OSTOST_17317 [Ostertagia ostertagi]